MSPKVFCQVPSAAKPIYTAVNAVAARAALDQLSRGFTRIVCRRQHLRCQARAQAFRQRPGCYHFFASLN